MQILERDEPLTLLNQAFARVRERSQGECVLSYGEAGIGKTSLVQLFVRDLVATPGVPANSAAAAKGKPAVNVLIAGCEALYTPRPLGPLVDLAARFASSVSDALHSGRTWNGLFPALLAALRDAPTPTVLVIEDMHWADAATLDFVRYLGRRLQDVRALVLLTYRSDELAADHPLRRVIGELPATTTTRIALAPLSAQAVATLAAASGRSARRVYEVTGGNPFYVSEVLATDGSGVPPSVNDAVLARLAGLSPAARELAERVSLFPKQADVAVLSAIAPATNEVMDECTQHGLLVTQADVAQGNTLAFRHELAREAAHLNIARFRRTALHSAAFNVLRAAGDSDELLARQVHHAEEAGLIEAVMSLAPRAARYAAKSGAHREAAELYALALRHCAPDATADRAALFEARALECTLAGLHVEAIRLRMEALAERRTLGDTRGAGINLRWLARLHGWGENFAAAQDYAREAITLLERWQADAELAIAYSTFSHLNLVAERMSDVRIWGNKAIALAEQVGDIGALSQALACVSMAQLRWVDDADAWQMLERSLELALAHQIDAEASFSFDLLHAMALVHRRYHAAIAYADRGIMFSDARGIDVFAVRLRIRRAFAHLQAGNWTLAAADLDNVRAHQTLPPRMQLVRDLVSTLLDLRSGAGDAMDRVTDVVAKMQAADVTVWFTSGAAAAAELAWLSGDHEALRAAVEPALEQALALGDMWRAGELVAWLVRGGIVPNVAVTGLNGPYALEAAGHARDAAAAWAKLGCPYERAAALASGDETELREALQQFEQLGALPAAEVARRRLRAIGARGVQRGPQSRTRFDPLGLTTHERAVFDLMLQGLPNNTIAARLHRSARTVENHVAAVFAKLDVHSRVELLTKFATLAGRNNEPTD